ncbi:MAG: ATP-binding protein [Caldilineaceae bacterium]
MAGQATVAPQHRIRSLLWGMMTQEALSFGPWLKQRRRFLDLTQEELAQRAACSLSTLRKIEAGDLLPSKELAGLLAVALGVPTTDRDAFIAFARDERRAALTPAFVPPPPPVVLPPATELLTAATTPPTNAPRHQLPAQLTAFIGRDAEVATVQQMLANPACALLTIVGPGGIGKTRLVLAVAQQILDFGSFQEPKFSDGVYFVSFVGVTGPEFMVSTLATAIGFSFASTGDPKSQLLNYLREKSMLLVLDNLEHLLEGVDLLVDLLQAAPGVKLLTTSRERLAVAGEWVFDLPSLASPPETAPGLVAVAGSATYPAVDLFVERAQRTRQGFALATRNEAAVAQICRLVGGMPLALELAASWVHTLSCAEIAREIEQSLDFLAVNHRNLPERQRSVRATFDHSWRLLSEAEQQVLQRLSVFRGGFQREAAIQVARATLPLLAGLVSKSLVRRTAEGRYDLHELVRQYAADHLGRDRQAEMQTRHTHADHFLGGLDDCTGLFNHQHAEMRKVLIRESKNLRLAWLWAAESGRYDLLARATPTFWLFHEVCFSLHEGRLLFTQALQMVTTASATGEPTLALSQVVWGELQAQQGWFLFRTGQFAEARPVLEQAVAHLRQQNEPLALADALHHLSVLEWFSASFLQGQHYALEALALNQRLGRQWWTGMCLVSLGYCAHFQGMYPMALDYFEEGVALMRSLGEPRTTAVFIGSLSETLLALGRTEETKVLLQEALRLATQLEDTWTVAKVYGQMGVATLHTGELEKAQHFLQQALDLFSERGDAWYWANSLNTSGSIYLKSGEIAHAQQRFLAAWRVSSQSQLVPSMLTAVAGLATVQAKDTLSVAHVVVAYYILNHTASTQEAKQYADQLRLRAEAEREPQEIAVARLQAQHATLESLAAEITMPNESPANAA